jgi:hypothetical protein
MAKIHKAGNPNAGRGPSGGAIALALAAAGILGALIFGAAADQDE